MPDLWVERPRAFPYRCTISGRSTPEDGPYYEFPLEYFTQEDGATQRLTISAKYLLAPFSKPDAPFKVLTAEAAEEIEQELEQLRDEVLRLESELNAANVELDRERDVFARARVKANPPKTTRRPKAAE